MAKTSKKLLSKKMHSARTSTEDKILEVYNTDSNQYPSSPFKIRFKFDPKTATAKFVEYSEHNDGEFTSSTLWKEYASKELYMFILEHTPAEKIVDKEDRMLAQVKFHGVN